MVVVSNPRPQQQPHGRPAMGLRGNEPSWNVWGHGPVPASPGDFGPVIVPL